MIFKNDNVKTRNLALLMNVNIQLIKDGTCKLKSAYNYGHHNMIHVNVMCQITRKPHLDISDEVDLMIIKFFKKIKNSVALFLFLIV